MACLVACDRLGARLAHAAALSRRFPARMLRANANHLSTVVTFRGPRTVNWQSPHCRKCALMHSCMPRRL